MTERTSSHSSSHRPRTSHRSSGEGVRGQPTTTPLSAFIASSATSSASSSYAIPHYHILRNDGASRGSSHRLPQHGGGESGEEALRAAAAAAAATASHRGGWMDWGARGTTSSFATTSRSSNSSPASGGEEVCGGYSMTLTAVKKRILEEAIDAMTVSHETEGKRGRKKKNTTHQKSTPQDAEEDEDLLPPKVEAHWRRAMKIAFGEEEKEVEEKKKKEKKKRQTKKNCTGANEEEGKESDGPRSHDGHTVGDMGTSSRRRKRLREEAENGNSEETPPEISECRRGEDNDDEIDEEAEQEVEEEEELTVSSVEFSLLCPYALRPMEFPTRSRHCLHLQCCDLESWMVMMSKARSLRDPTTSCPYCQQRVSASSLEVDLWMLHLVKEVMPAGTKLILLDRSGSVRSGDRYRAERRQHGGGTGEPIVVDVGMEASQPEGTTTVVLVDGLEAEEEDDEDAVGVMDPTFFPHRSSSSFGLPPSSPWRSSSSSSSGGREKGNRGGGGGSCATAALRFAASQLRTFDVVKQERLDEQEENDGEAASDGIIGAASPPVLRGEEEGRAFHDTMASLGIPTPAGVPPPGPPPPPPPFCTSSSATTVSLPGSPAPTQEEEEEEEEGGNAWRSSPALPLPGTAGGGRVDATSPTPHAGAPRVGSQSPSRVAEEEHDSEGVLGVTSSSSFRSSIPTSRMDPATSSTMATLPPRRTSRVLPTSVHRLWYRCCPSCGLGLWASLPASQHVDVDHSQHRTGEEGLAQLSLLVTPWSHGSDPNSKPRIPPPPRNRRTITKMTLRRPPEGLGGTSSSSSSSFGPPFLATTGREVLWQGSSGDETELEVLDGVSCPQCGWKGQRWEEDCTLVRFFCAGLPSFPSSVRDRTRSTEQGTIALPLSSTSILLPTEPPTLSMGYSCATMAKRKERRGEEDEEPQERNPVYPTRDHGSLSSHPHTPHGPGHACLTREFESDTEEESREAVAVAAEAAAAEAAAPLKTDKKKEETTRMVVVASMELTPDGTLLLRGMDEAVDYLRGGGFSRSLFVTSMIESGPPPSPPSPSSRRSRSRNNRNRWDRNGTDQDDPHRGNQTFSSSPSTTTPWEGASSTFPRHGATTHAVGEGVVSLSSFSSSGVCEEDGPYEGPVAAVPRCLKTAIRLAERGHQEPEEEMEEEEELEALRLPPSLVSGFTLASTTTPPPTSRTSVASYWTHPFSYNGVWASSFSFSRLELDFLESCGERIAWKVSRTGANHHTLTSTITTTTATAKTRRNQKEEEGDTKQDHQHGLAYFQTLEGRGLVPSLFRPPGRRRGMWDSGGVGGGGWSGGGALHLDRSQRSPPEKGWSNGGGGGGVGDMRTTGEMSSHGSSGSSSSFLTAFSSLSSPRNAVWSGAPLPSEIPPPPPLFFSSSSSFESHSPQERRHENDPVQNGMEGIEEGGYGMGRKGVEASEPSTSPSFFRSSEVSSSFPFLPLPPSSNAGRAAVVSSSGDPSSPPFSSSLPPRSHSSHSSFDGRTRGEGAKVTHIIDDTTLPPASSSNLVFPSTNFFS